MSKSLVCIDASVVLKLVLPEEHAERASRLWKDWLVNDIGPVAPLLLRYEVTSALRKNVHRGLIAQNSADIAFAGINRIMASQVRIVDLMIFTRNPGSWRAASIVRPFMTVIILP